jgi:hypothetical protein
LRPVKALFPISSSKRKGIGSCPVKGKNPKTRKICIAKKQTQKIVFDFKNINNENFKNS